MTSVCRACGTAHDGAVFYAAGPLPVNSCLLIDDAAAARSFPVGDLALVLCPACGLIRNDRFDPELPTYAAAYEETQAFSPRFVRYQDELIDALDRAHRLAGKSVLEIGCGKGDFLARLVERTGASGVGIDPAFRPDRHPGPALERLTFITDVYRPAAHRFAADLVCCRHTLEHIADVRGFLSAIRAGMAERPAANLLIEVPDATRILAERAFWDIYYEHCNYFTAGSLARAVRLAGFAVRRVETVYDGQYLLLEARPAGTDEPPGEPLPGEEPVAATAARVEAFGAAVTRQLHELRAELDGWAGQGRRVVLWGSGSKAAGYLTTLGIGAEVLAVCDINPHKAGKHQAGTGHPIVAPADLAALAPDIVIIMNPIYQDEIARTLAELGLAPELRTLERP